MGMLCDVIDDSNIDNNTIWFINDMNDLYIFSLLPHILVYKVHDFALCHVWPCDSSTWCLPSPKLNPHWNLTLNWKDIYDISIHGCYISS